jgi:hypothetical protein
VVRCQQIKAFSTSRGGVYPRPLFFRRIVSNGALQNIKFQYSMTKTKNKFGPPQADWSLLFV